MHKLIRDTCKFVTRLRISKRIYVFCLTLICQPKDQLGFGTVFVHQNNSREK